MTCVVAITNGKTVWMGSDSAACEETSGTLHLMADGKVWKRGELVMGVSANGTGIMQALRYHLTLEPIFAEHNAPDGVDPLMHYMVNVFAGAARKCLEEGDLLKKGAMDAHILVGLRGRLFMVEGSFGVVPDPEPFNAIGSGGAEAKGALWTFDLLRRAMSVKWLPEKILEVALEVSERYTSTVRRPWHFVSTSEGNGVGQD